MDQKVLRQIHRYVKKLGYPTHEILNVDEDTDYRAYVAVWPAPNHCETLTVYMEQPIHGVTIVSHIM